MLGKKAYPTSARTQYNVVNYLKGTTGNPYPNSSGSLNDARVGASHVAYSNGTFLSGGVKSFSWLEAEIRSGQPVIAAATYVSVNAGHMVIVYATHRDTATARQLITYYDPGDGMNRQCTYNSFLDGSYNSRTYSETVWIQ